MKGPVRLRELDRDVALLLSALEEEAPPEGAVTNALTALGETSSGPPSLAPVGFSRSSMTPWLAGLAAIALSVAGFRAMHATSDDPAPLSSSASVAVRPESPTASLAPHSDVTDSVAIVRVEDLRPAVTMPAAGTDHAPPADHPRPANHAPTAHPRASKIAASPTTASASPTATGTSFDEELALVEVARAHLGGGDAVACLRSLDDYERRFQHGLFGPEVLVMRIEALVALGDRGRARELGEAFLAKDPASPHAGRVRSILATQ
jgi:hypothetical protein